jgi:regulation of enolase protein 1 (concanavalin A-like superfamily)
MMSKRKVNVLYGMMWAAALSLAVPVMAAAPTGYQEANIGAPDMDGSTDIAGDVWTVSGSGNDFNGATEDQLYFVYKSIKGNGSVQARMRGAGSGGSQYAGVMLRESVNANAPIAGLIMSTSALNWITRTAADEAATRQSGVSAQTYPKWMRVQRVGNSITGFTSEDGRLWQQISGPTELPLAESTVMGIAVSSRSSDLTTVEFDNVQIQEGVVSVTGVEGAATPNMALIAWQPISTAVGYNVYRGPKGATLDKMALLNAAPQTDTFYFDNAASDTPLRDLSYVVAAVFNGTDGKPVEGPAVRAR